MKLEFDKMTKAEQYVSPSLDTASVHVENGFCNSNSIAPYGEGEEAGFGFGE